MNRGFLKAVGVLMTGSAIAQLIPIFFMPLLTRMYVPEQFGLYGEYIALITILSIFFSLKLDFALMIPRRDIVSDYLLKLVVFVVLIMLLVFYVLLFFIWLLNELIGFFYFENYYFLIPIASAFFATYSVVLNYLNRKSCYKKMGFLRVFQSGSITFFQVGFSFFEIFGLIVLDFFGRFFSNIFGLKVALNRISCVTLSQRKVFYLLKRFKNFPLYELPANLMNTASFNLPYIVLPFVFGGAFAGSYFLVFRVLMLPISLVGGAVGEAFKVKAKEKFDIGKGCKELFLKTAVGMFMLGVVPVVLITQFGEQAFMVVFGDEWGNAGVLAAYIAPLALLRFVSSPLSSVIILKERNRVNFVFQMIFFVMVVLSLFYAYYSGNGLDFVRLISFVGVVFYCFQILYSYYLSLGVEYEDLG